LKDVTNISTSALGRNDVDKSVAPKSGNSHAANNSSDMKRKDSANSTEVSTRSNSTKANSRRLSARLSSRPTLDLKEDTDSQSDKGQVTELEKREDDQSVKEESKEEPALRRKSTRTRVAPSSKLNQAKKATEPSKEKNEGEALTRRTTRAAREAEMGAHFGDAIKESMQMESERFKVAGVSSQSETEMTARSQAVEAPSKDVPEEKGLEFNEVPSKSELERKEAVEDLSKREPEGKDNAVAIGEETPDTEPRDNIRATRSKKASSEMSTPMKRAAGPRKEKVTKRRKVMPAGPVRHSPRAPKRTVVVEEKTTEVAIAVDVSKSKEDAEKIADLETESPTSSVATKDEHAETEIKTDHDLKSDSAVITSEIKVLETFTVHESKRPDQIQCKTKPAIQPLTYPDIQSPTLTISRPPIQHPQYDLPTPMDMTTCPLESPLEVNTAPETLDNMSQIEMRGERAEVATGQIELPNHDLSVDEVLHEFDF
jgi:hypothetical protein